MFKTKTGSRITIAILFIGLLTIAGCGRETVKDEPADAAVPEATNRQERYDSSSIEDTALVESAVPEWEYDLSVKWDAFKKPTHEPPPITYGLDQMRLMGIVRGPGMDGAFILMPNNTDRIVHVNDRLGKHKGLITEIGPDYLIVEQRFINPCCVDEMRVIEKKLILAANGITRH